MNEAKILKTVRGTIKKGIFYLGVNFPYTVTQELISPLVRPVQKISEDYPVVGAMFDMDKQIRNTDDVLDDKLARIIPFPEDKMRRTINNFSAKSPLFSEVAELFHTELDIRNCIGFDDIKIHIHKIIELRPCDFFLLMKYLLNECSTKLDHDNLIFARSFFYEFQRLRDLFDDIMSTEEDSIKGSYNSIILAQNHGIPHVFFEEIIEQKFQSMKDNIINISSHPHYDLLKDTIKFWEKEYKLLFEPLLKLYYQNMEKYKKYYFMFKQI